MWHGRGACFGLLNFLFEIIHRNVRPHVAVEIDEDRIDPLQVVEKGRHVIVMLYLRGGLASFEPECAVHEPVGEFYPVDTRIGNLMGIEVSGRPAKFSRNRNCFKHCQLHTKTLNKDVNLFANRSGGGGLSMGAGKHGHMLPLFTALVQRMVDIFEKRFKNVIVGVAHCQG